MTLLTPILALFAMALLLAPATLRAQPAEAGQPGTDGDASERGWDLRANPPSIRFGDLLRLDLTSKVDLVLRDSPDVDVDGVAIDRRRIGVDGRLFGAIAFQIERDLGDNEQPWRDVFVEVRTPWALRVRGGRFKIPFGQERLTSIGDIDFVQRSLPTESLTPARDTGIQIEGRSRGRGWVAQAGVFAHDGDVARGGTDSAAGRTVAGRLVGTPLWWAGPRTLRRLEMGVAATVGDVPEGLNGLRARTSGGFEAMAPVYVRGRRVRIGAEARFTQGPMSVSGEFLQSRDERAGQGIGDTGLPDMVGRGWYVSATSFAVGRLASGGTGPLKPLGRGGIGTIQLAARIDALGFRSDASSEPAFRNPRAAHVLPNDVRNLTLGVNWFPVRYVKVQWNVVREHLQDPERRPDPARAWITSQVVRVLFSL